MTIGIMLRVVFSPPPAAYRGSGRLLDPGPSVCPFVCLSVCPSTFQVGFYSATELQNYWAESNQTFYNKRIYIEVVQLDIGFVVRPKFGSSDLVKRGISTQFGVCYSATELYNYGTESNGTFYNIRIYIEVVHLGIGFVVRPKMPLHGLGRRGTSQFH